MNRVLKVLVIILLVVLVAGASSLLTAGWMMSQYEAEISDDAVRYKMERLTALLDTYFIDEYDQQKLEAAAAAVIAMGLAGEIAYDHLQQGEGNSTYRNRIIDAIYHMDGDTLDQGARYEVF